VAELDAYQRGWGQGWPADRRADTVTVTDGQSVKLAVHRGVAPIVAYLLGQTVRGVGRNRGYALRGDWCWGYGNRAIRGSNRPSNHSWGLAVDLNAPNNPMSPRLVTDMPEWMVGLWKSHMFRWGGDYRRRKDAMHYEFIGTPDDAERLIIRLGDVTPLVAPTAQPGDDGEPVLRMGSSGPWVVKLQTILSGPFGFALGKIDGVFGRRTSAAVKKVQRQHRLGDDGVVGAKTWAVLNAGSAPKQISLTLRSSGAQVARLQTLLNEWKKAPRLATDGQFGERTRNAVIEFQRAVGLGADGIVGPRTWARLLQATGHAA